MAHYPQNATGLGYITYPAGPTPLGVTVTSHASANTKGAYAEIAASTAFTCTRMRICVQFTVGTAGRRFLLDIATGAASSESVIVANIPFEGFAGSALAGSGIVDLPVAIPSGTRISARCQCSTGGTDMAVIVSLSAAGGSPGIASFTTYGADTSDSGGTEVDPGASANTKGGYSELTASTSGVIQSLGVVLTSQGNTTPVGTRWYLDIATGAASSEVVLIPDLPFVLAINSGSDMVTVIPRCIPLLTYIAAGTRVAVRASCSVNNATDRLCDVALIAGTAPAESGGSGGESSYVFVG